MATGEKREKDNGISKYLQDLDAEHASRYRQKISVVENIDPYTLKKQDLTSDIRYFPSITYPDIVNYMLFAPSPVTSEELKCYKSLDAFNQFMQGWVKEIGVKVCKDERLIVSGRVKHSQRLSDTPLSAWFIAENGGKILYAHCNCMAGLGESCSHVGALMFYIEAAVRIRESKTVTQEKAYWLLPSAHKEVEYKEVVSIDFTAPKTAKRKLDCKISEPNESSNQPKVIKNVSCYDKYKAPTTVELDTFYELLSKCGSKPAILSIITPYSKDYAPKLLKEDYPKILTELYDLNAVDQNYTELLKTCESIKIEITKEQAVTVEHATKAQSNDKAWFRFRAGRITASKMHNVCHTDVALPSQSLIKGICYPESYRFSSKATDWGCQHEKVARNLYETSMIEVHQDFKVHNSGLHISLDHPFIGASPDGYVSCVCCGEGCLEIKCPHCNKDQFIFEAAENKKFCIEKNGSEYRLSHKHPYCYQVQTQLNVCKKDYCDFYVWTEKDYHIERIYPDTEFWSTCVEKSSQFFRLCLLPELVGKFYSRNASIIKSISTCDAQEMKYCYCKKGEYGDMIGCDNTNCPCQWFHYECIGLKCAPKGKWYCPDCRKLDTFERKKKRVTKKKN